MLEHAGVSVRLLRPVLAALRAAGVDVEPVLRELALEPATLADPDGRVLHRQTLLLWQRAVELTLDDALGLHVGEGVDISLLEVQGYAILSSATLGQALVSATRLHRLNHDAARVGLFEEDAGAVWRHELPGGVVLPRQPAEFVMALALSAARQATGLELAPQAVHFAHPAPSSTAEHRRIFQAPVHFGRGENALVLHPESLALPCVKADPALLALLERHATDLLARMPQADTFTDRVLSLLAAQLRDGDPSAERVAARLNMSVRTLSRRLREQGTSHMQLLDTLRQQLADSYLADPHLGIAEIGFLLGFGDASSFHRAFRRWYGKTPAQYRRRGAGSGSNGPPAPRSDDPADGALGPETLSA